MGNKALQRLIATTALLLVVGQASAQLAEIEVRRDLEYASQEGTKLVGDLYAPRTAGTHPALIAVYDGARLTGVDAWASYFAQHGYVVLAIEHRLIRPAGQRYPQALHDVRAAARYLRSNWNPSDVTLVADTAAAHLSALVALGEAEFLEEFSSDPSATYASKTKVCVGKDAYELYIAWPRSEPRT